MPSAPRLTSDRARSCLLGAALCIAAMFAVWLGAHEVAALRRVDASVLGGFEALRRPWLNRLADGIANLCDPVPYVLLAAVPIAVALLRGRRRTALVVLLILIGANETTELLKPVLAGAHDAVDPISPGSASWPSGHATAAMSLALTMVLVVPARRRPLVGAAMAAFTVAVCFSFLVLGWHYPSDVLGGFLVAATWTLIGVAALDVLARVRPGASRAVAGPGSVRRTRPQVSLGHALTPPLAFLAAGTALALLIAITRPHAVLSFARAHEFFLVGAVVIAALSFALAAALGLILRGPRYPDSPR